MIQSSASYSVSKPKIVSTSPPHQSTPTEWPLPISYLRTTKLYSARRGLVLNSADPVNIVGAVLSRRANDVGDTVKVGRGTWGLKEWYPGRSFKKRADKEEEETTGAETTAS